MNGNTVKLGMDGTDTSGYVGTGSCVVYDWVPVPAIKDPWYNMNKKMEKLNMAYYIWVTAFSQYFGQFYREVGTDPIHWGLNLPKGSNETGIIRWSLPNHNILDKRFRDIFTQRIDDVHKNYGFQGIWADSYQLSYMSQLDWADGTGESMQRAWWEQISKWTRDGIGWMGESMSFPGLSCSIEVADWEKDYWAFQYVCKWLRNGEHKRYSSEELDHLGFLLMANKGWLAFDILEWSYDGPYWNPVDIMPNFKKYSEQYMAALPSMKRPYILPNESGMLWLSGFDEEGVLFVFSRELTIPPDVYAFEIVSGEKQSTIVPYNCYVLKGSNLLGSFGSKKGILTDERKEMKMDQINYAYPDYNEILLFIFKMKTFNNRFKVNIFYYFQFLQLKTK